MHLLERTELSTVKKPINRHKKLTNLACVFHLKGATVGTVHEIAVSMSKHHF